jgi:hypothetical protein
MGGGCYRSNASCKQSWPGLYSSDEKPIPGTDYLTQNFGIEQAAIGRGVIALRIAGFWSREKGIHRDSSFDR